MQSRSELLEELLPLAADRKNFELFQKWREIADVPIDKTPGHLVGLTCDELVQEILAVAFPDDGRKEKESG